MTELDKITAKKVNKIKNYHYCIIKMKFLPDFIIIVLYNCDVSHLIVSVLGGLVSHVKLFSRSSAVLSAVVTPVAIAML